MVLVPANRKLWEKFQEKPLKFVHALIKPELGNDKVGRCIEIIYTCSRFCIRVSVYEFIMLKKCDQFCRGFYNFFKIRDIMQHLILILYSKVKGTHKNPWKLSYCKWFHKICIEFLILQLHRQLTFSVYLLSLWSILLISITAAEKKEKNMFKVKL